jgi:carboxymethylenebutenolidase
MAGDFSAYLALPPAGWPGHSRHAGNLWRQSSHARRLRLVCGARVRPQFVLICFGGRNREVDITDRTDAEWQKAFQLYQGLDEAKAVEDSAAALEFLRKHPACTGRAGGVGFCLGGNLAWLLSVRFKPDCAVGYYGVSIEKEFA